MFYFRNVNFISSVGASEAGASPCEVMSGDAADEVLVPPNHRALEATVFVAAERVSSHHSPAGGNRNPGLGIRERDPGLGSGRACTRADRSMCGRSEPASDARGVSVKNVV